jgi:hypothetical protein
VTTTSQKVCFHLKAVPLLPRRHKEIGVQLLLILDLGARWVSGQRQAPAALYPGNELPIPIGQEAGWASELVWTQRLEDKSFASAGHRTPVVESVVRYYTD